MSGEERLVWLAWERQGDGGFRVIETRGAPRGDTSRHRRDFATLEAAAAVYGPEFRTLVEDVLASGSDRGRYRP